MVAGVIGPAAYRVAGACPCVLASNSAHEPTAVSLCSNRVRPSSLEMLSFAERLLQAFIPMFVAVDPIGLAAIFLGLGQGVAAKQRQLIARQATLTGGAVALLFLFLGANIFKAVGISVSDFQIAGGLILF